jgi:hypothetical protein
MSTRLYRISALVTIRSDSILVLRSSTSILIVISGLDSVLVLIEFPGKSHLLFSEANSWRLSFIFSHIVVLLEQLSPLLHSQPLRFWGNPTVNILTNGRATVTTIGLLSISCWQVIGIVQALCFCRGIISKLLPLIRVSIGLLPVSGWRLI